MKNWQASIVVFAALLAGCAGNQGRPGVASRTLDCYDWWPYVYSAPVDCWYGRSAWYDPSYSYYRPYPGYASPVASAPSTGVPKASRPRTPLAERDRHPIRDAAPELPLPVLHPPRTLP